MTENQPNSKPSPSARNGRAAEPGMFSCPRSDFLASIVVFLVALPLCMGIAIASGVPVAAGLITGVVGGLIVGWFAGAPLQVSGPAAGLTVIVYELVRTYGLEYLGIAVLIGGVLQFVAGMLRYGRWFRAVSPAVIRGMLAGIGVLILSSQFHVMVDDAPKGSGIQNLLSIPEAIEKGLPLPEWRSTAQREVKRDLLQKLGALHEEQVQIRERVAEHRQAADDGVDSTTSWEELATWQGEITDRLDALVAEMTSQTVLEATSKPDALRAAATAALDQNNIALRELQEGHAESFRESQTNAQQSLEDVFKVLKNHEWAAKVGMLTILSLVLWKTVTPKKLRLVPAPLVAVIVATIAATWLKLPVLYVEVPDNLWGEIHFPTFAVLQSAPWKGVIQAGIVLAVVASAETLLCATAVDQMQTETRTNYNRELAAQGVGNMICGLMGALPMTGVIVRSSANVDAGAKTRLSTILHGAWLLIFVSFLAFILRMIPTAALAAMLVYTGYKLIDIKSVKELRKYGWSEVAIYLITVAMIVLTDLLTGVLVGVALSAAKLLYTFSHLETRLEMEEGSRKAVLRLNGAATFIRLPVLAEALEEVPGDVELHVNFEHLDYIDHACLDLLINWDKQHEATGGTLVIDWETLHANFLQENGNRSTSPDRVSA